MLELAASAFSGADANQPPPLVDYNVVAADTALLEGVRREGAGWCEPELLALGETAGSAEAIAWGFDANRYEPVLRALDARGFRRDEVEFHPSYHRLMETATAYGLHALSWRRGGPGAHVARSALFYAWSQVDAGHGCPISMTHAAVAALRAQPDVASLWMPRLTSLSYEPALRPVAQKSGALCGMAMTERQGGSDVRANVTRAVADGLDGTYRLQGQKWFCSAPMCDAFLVLAQAPDGLTCFLLPRVLSNGEKNAIRIVRLKDKLGNRSNASSEVEFDGALAHRVGAEGRGIQTIIEMVNFTRLDCITGTAATMRAGLAQAIHHATYRRAFGTTLRDAPAMRNVLADLALESEAATMLFLRLARACDSASDEREAALKRIGTALGKYWVCKRGPAFAAEALECLGGNGYVEEGVMPRLYREMPVNSIWEGSGNVNALDVLRALRKEPAAVDALFSEIGSVRGSDARLDRAAEALRGTLLAGNASEGDARRIAERLALALCGALLVRHAPAAVADGFCASRLEGDWGHAFGTLPGSVDTKAIVDRAWPREGLGAPT